MVLLKLSLELEEIFLFVWWNAISPIEELLIR